MGLMKGIKAPWLGAEMIFRHKKMLLIALVPFVLNIIVLLLFYFFGFVYLTETLEQWLQISTGNSSFWLKALAWIVKTIVAAALFFIMVLLYLTTAAIIAAPFNDILSEMTEKILQGQAPSADFSFTEFMRDIWRIARQEIRKLFLLLLIMVLSSVLHMLPLIGSALYALINYGSLAFFTGIEYLDFPLERRRLEFSDKLKYSRKYWTATIGVGAVTAFFLFIPMVFSFSAVGATILYFDIGDIHAVQKNSASQ